MQTTPTNAGNEPNEGKRRPFDSIEWPRTHSWRQLVTSLGFHLAAGVVLGLISLFFIPVITDPDRNIEITFLSDPPVEPDPVLPERVTPPPPKPVVRPEPKREPEPEAVRIPDEIVPPKVVEKPAPKPPEPVIRKPLPKFETPPAPAPPPKRELKTAGFTEGSSAPPTTTAPAKNVQTGGFGDPNGVAGNATSKSPVAKPNLGSFELPQGPGKGNGTGGANGTAGTVRSTGFGNGVASDAAATSPGSDRGVKEGGFAQAKAVVEAPRTKQKPVEANTLPVEIVFKPTPAYTAEARQRRLEGEVVLEVLFTAAGRPQVLRVVSGLGSGLDESAMRAAEKIQFKPARRDGQAVDYTAVVRILFQLT